MIIFRKIFYKNFLSSGNNGIEVSLDSHNKTLLQGPSGSGKSSVVDAITFALFNKPFRNINKPNLTNSINNKQCLVEISFTIGTKNYKVRRGLKPVVFEIYQDDVLINQDAAAKDYQDFLENSILKLNYRAFIQVVALGASNFTSFMLLKAADRRALVEDLLDIKVFSIMNIILKKKYSALEKEKEMLERDITSFNQQIKIHEEYANKIKVDIEHKRKELEEKKNKLELELIPILETLEVLKKEIQTVDTIEKNTLNNKLQEYNKLEIKLQTKKKELLKRLSFYQDNSKCPTCEQDIEEKFCKHNKDTYSLKINELEVASVKIQKQKEDIQNRLDILEKISEQNRQKELLIKENTLKSSFITNKIQEIEIEINKLKHEDKTVDESVIQQLRNDRDSTKLRYDGANDILLNFDICHKLLKDDGVKSLIVKQYIPVINQTVNRYLQQMSFFIKFEMDEEFNEKISSRARDEFSYGNFSDGERQRIDLALLFTWREIAKLKNSVSTNLLIIDELADSFLDNDTTEVILDLLTSGIFKDLNVFLISHKNGISEKFDRIMKFNKVKNFSNVVYE